MTPNFERAFAFTHSWECWGGAKTGTCRIGDDPKDPGGRTIHGIARNYHPALWAAGPPTVEQAKPFYYEQFWLKAHCDKFRWPMCLVVFDWAVNAGEDNPARALQVMSGLSVRKVDQDIGPHTVELVHAWMARLVARETQRARMLELLTSPRAKHVPGWADRMAALEAEIGPS
jgi:lysozyme family protein